MLNMNLGENYIQFTKSNITNYVPKTTGVYILALKIHENQPVTPVYVGRACGDVQNLLTRVRKYRRVLDGGVKKKPVIDHLLSRIRDENFWYITWKEFPPIEAKKVEYEILKKTNLNLVNAIGMGKGCQERALLNAMELIEQFNMD